MKIKNFSAGPSKIPQVVLDQISEDIKEYKNLGYSILELSHRTEAFQEIVNNVKDKISNILNIPKGYEILLIQGGATFQNTFIPANKASLKENVLFLLSGTWGKKTHKDFEKYYNYIIPQLSLYDDFSEDVFKKITQATSKKFWIIKK
jgi:phosphoserine aminotransferase